MLVADRDKEERVLIHLEDRFIPYPALAIEQSRRTVNDMARISGRALRRSLSLFDNYNEPLYQKIIQHGFIFNDITTFCERISNHCTNIAAALMD